jgi:hypothetical protein
VISKTAEVAITSVISATCVRDSCRFDLSHQRSPLKPPLCHQLEYTFHWPELWSVDFTAAAEGNSFLVAGDATAVSKESGYLPAVCQSEAGCAQSKTPEVDFTEAANRILPDPGDLRASQNL